MYEHLYDVDPNTGCHIWHGSTGNDGYGRVWDPIKGTMVRAAGHIYTQEKGPIPKGFQIDHLCRNRLCVNTDHLEAVTPQENVRRSDNYVGVNFRKTHCIHGHPFEGDNLIILDTKRGKERRCRECTNEKARKYAKRSYQLRKENPLSPVVRIVRIRAKQLGSGGT